MAGIDNLKPMRKGETRNPGGRPKVPQHIKEMARALTEEALSTAAEIMRNPGETGTARMTAVNAILDRAWGKPTQEITATITQSHEAMLDALAADDAGEIALPVH